MPRKHFTTSLTRTMPRPRDWTVYCRSRSRAHGALARRNRGGRSATRSASGKPQQSMGDFRDAATPLLDASVARKGPTLRHTEWRDELLRTGLRGKGGHHIDFSRVEPLAGTRWLHADAETKGAKPERVVISFGPEHSLLEQRQVELAWEEARTLSPKPAILVFAAFEFDPEAAKDIDGMTKEKTGMTFLTAQMNADLLTEDLKKKRASNQGFWLVGRPDVEVREIAKGDNKGKWRSGSPRLRLLQHAHAAPSNPAILRRLRCGCSTRITMAAASILGRFSSRWPMMMKAGRGLLGI